MTPSTLAAPEDEIMILAKDEKGIAIPHFSELFALPQHELERCVRGMSQLFCILFTLPQLPLFHL